MTSARFAASNNSPIFATVLFSSTLAPNTGHDTPPAEEVDLRIGDDERRMRRVEYEARTR